MVIGNELVGNRFFERVHWVACQCREREKEAPEDGSGLVTCSSWWKDPLLLMRLRMFDVAEPGAFWLMD